MPLTGPSPANSRYPLNAKATSTRAASPRKNPLTTGNPYTGTFRSQRLLGVRSIVAAALVVVVALIVAPSIRFLFRAHGLLVRAPRDSCESPAPAQRRARRAERNTDRNASAIAGFLLELTPAPIPAGQVSRKGHGTDTRPACRRCQSPHTRDSGSSVRDCS